MAPFCYAAALPDWFQFCVGFGQGACGAGPGSGARAGDRRSPAGGPGHGPGPGLGARGPEAGTRGPKAAGPWPRVRPWGLIGVLRSLPGRRTDRPTGWLAGRAAGGYLQTRFHLKNYDFNTRDTHIYLSRLYSQRAR